MLEQTNDASSFLDDFELDSSNDIITEVDGLEGVDKLEFKPEDQEQEKFVPDEEEEEQKEDEQEEGFSYKAFLTHLNEQGLVQFEDREDLEDTPDVVYESINRTVQEGIKSYKDSIPETGKQFLDYLEKGGDPKKYIDTLQRPINLDKLDLDNESDQELVMREYLKLSDYSSEEIDETIADYKDGLLLDKQSKVAFKKLEKSFDKRNESLIKEQEAYAESQREQYANYQKLVDTTIESSTNLAGLEITKAEKDSFKKYLLLRDKDGLTSYEREVQEDPVKTQLELAYLKFKKYDFASAKKQGESEATKKLNWKLKNNDKTVTGGKSSQEVKDEGGLGAFGFFKRKQG